MLIAVIGKRILPLLAWLVPALMLAGQVQAAARDPLTIELPATEVIPGAQWQWVGQRMAINDIPISIKVFTYPGSAEEVKRFYLDRWRLSGLGKLSQQTVGNARIITYQLDQHVYSVQFAQHGDNVDGKLVVSLSPLSRRPSRDTRLPLPPRTQVASKVESLDGGRRSETLTLESRLGVPQVIDFYINRLQNDGWQRYSASGDGRSGAVISFQRQGELLQLNIKGLQGRNSNSSEVLLNWVK